MTKCLYCGRRQEDNRKKCVSCGAPMHYQKNGWSLSATKRFIYLVITITIFSVFMILYLPR
jgi:uncharacterized membrane protein YvbJ